MSEITYRIPDRMKIVDGKEIPYTREETPIEKATTEIIVRSDIYTLASLNRTLGNIDSEIEVLFQRKENLLVLKAELEKALDS